MKKTIILCSLAAIVAFIAGLKVGQPNDLQNYREYYNATEALLDTLESHYNWVDAFDPTEYYESVKSLKK